MDDDDRQVIIPDRKYVDLACVLAREHHAQTFVFWTADDWLQPYGALLQRADPENVLVRVRALSRGGSLGYGVPG